MTNGKCETLSEITREIGATLPCSADLSILAQTLDIGGRTVPNRLAVQPMEGADGNADGSPGELTLRRYRRFAGGGAGLIWAEAISVAELGRGNPRHLWLHEGNLDCYKAMVDMMREEAMRAHGHDITIIAQITHAGRYSKPYGKPLPVVAVNNPWYEGDAPLTADRIITDDELDRLEEDFERTTLLAQKAGFDGADIKACHRYLMSELLSAFTRKGRFGGTYEGRTAFLRHCVQRVRAACSSDFIITSRMNIYDGVPNPFGWGQSEQDYLTPDFAEPLKLIGELHAGGMTLLDVTMGNPYVNPHVNRPYKRGGYAPPEHPMKGVERILGGAGVVQQAFPGLAVICSGVSYLGANADVVAAGMVRDGLSSMVGFGRMAFAYPDFAADILSGNGLDSGKACLACTKCTELMRAGTTAGCPVRDQEAYLGLYRERCMKKG